MTSERERQWAEDRETEAGRVERADARTFLFVREGETLRFLDLDDPGEWIIGRGSQAQIAVEDSQVSRRHAKLALSGGVLSLEDLGSRNGTTVNGQVVHSTTVRLGTGDVVEIGRCQLAVATRAGRASETRTTSEDGTTVDVVLADPEMVRVHEALGKAAVMSTTVLILGETGTGKDVLAQHLHARSSRASRPFVRVNCAGLPDSLLESELFGYERGAFTGADRRKAGYFEAAQGGTLFLDEVGEILPTAQVKLLHVLENRTVTRLGGTAPVTVDVRVVCATHRDLRALVAEERFRADLFYRISPFVVHVPPLRDRTAEIPLLASVFVRALAEQIGAPPPTVAPDALAMLMAYRWPGNVRELRNAVEHAFVMAQGATIRKDHFAPEVRGLAPTARATPEAKRGKILDAERRAIEDALTAEDGNQTRAAARLGMPRRTLVYKLAKYRRDDSS